MELGIYFILLSSILFIFYFLLKNEIKDKTVKTLVINPKDLIKYTPIEGPLNKMEGELLTLINDYRVSIGVHKLKIDFYSRNLCYDHIGYMLNTKLVNHKNLDKRVYQLSLRGAKMISELVCDFYSKPEQFLNHYLKNDSNRNIIESSDYTHIGIGLVEDYGGNHYNIIIFTQFF